MSHTTQSPLKSFLFFLLPAITVFVLLSLLWYSRFDPRSKALDTGYTLRFSLENTASSSATYNVLVGGKGTGASKTLTPGQSVTDSYSIPSLPAVIKADTGAFTIANYSILTASGTVVETKDPLNTSIGAGYPSARYTVNAPVLPSPTPTAIPSPTANPSPSSIPSPTATASATIIPSPTQAPTPSSLVKSEGSKSNATAEKLEVSVSPQFVRPGEMLHFTTASSNTHCETGDGAPEKLMGEGLSFDIAIPQSGFFVDRAGTFDSFFCRIKGQSGFVSIHFLVIPPLNPQYENLEVTAEPYLATASGHIGLIPHSVRPITSSWTCYGISSDNLYFGVGSAVGGHTLVSTLPSNARTGSQFQYYCSPDDRDSARMNGYMSTRPITVIDPPSPDFELTLSPPRISPGTTITVDSTNPWTVCDFPDDSWSVGSKLQWKVPSNTPLGKDQIYFHCHVVSYSRYKLIQFDVVASLPAPVVLTPVNGTLITTDTATLTWRASLTPTPDHYEVQISTNPLATFDAGIVHSASVPSPTLSYVTPTSLAKAKIYYWRVRAVTAKGEQSAYSAPIYFKLAPPAPTLLSPVNGASNITSLRPTFDWSDVPGATNYYIRVSRYPTFTSPTVGAYVGSATSSYTPVVNMPEGVTMYWRVFTVSSVGNSGWSDTFSFLSANPPATPILRSPVSGTILTSQQIPPLRFTVAKVAGELSAPKFDLQIATNATFTTLVKEKSSIPLTPDTGSTATLDWFTYTTTETLPPNATYYWRVRATTAKGEQSAWSAGIVFRIPLPAPTLLSPTNGSHLDTLRPTFDWSDVTGSTLYLIQTSTNGTTWRNLATKTTSAYTALADLSPRGSTIYWRVLPYNTTYRYGIPSTAFSFTLPNPPAAPVLRTPTYNAIVTTTPTFTWTLGALAGAPAPTALHLQISKFTSFAAEDMVYEKTDISPSTLSFTLPTPLPTGKRLYWRMRTGTNGEWSNWSYISNAVSYSTVRIPLTAAILLTPANGSTAVVTRPKLTWERVNGAERYYVQRSTNGTSFAAWGTTLDNITSYIPTADVLPFGSKVYWRVLAWNSITGYAPASQVFSFTSANPTTAVPTLVSPATGSLNFSRTPTFVWNPVAGATGYVLELSRIPDFLGEIKAFTTTSSTYQMSTALDPATTYYWRVRSVGANGTRSNPSAIRNVTTQSITTMLPLTVTPIRAKYGEWITIQTKPDAVCSFDASRSDSVYELRANSDGIMLYSSGFSSPTYVAMYCSLNGVLSPTIVATVGI